MTWDEQAFYQNLTNQSALTTEKTFVDKVLARRNIEKIEDLLRKEEWDREDLNLLLYFLVSEEIKLLYFRDWDRYILGKYFVWHREIVRIGELYYDVEARLKEKLKNMEKKDKTYFQRLKTMKRIEKQLLASIRFATDIFLYLARSSLSMYGKAFDTLLKTRVEYEYKHASGEAPQTSEYDNYVRGVGGR